MNWARTRPGVAMTIEERNAAGQRSIRNGWRIREDIAIDAVVGRTRARSL